MATIEIENMRSGYSEIIARVLTLGHRTAPRGQPTLEMLDTTVVLLDPRDALPIGVGRGVNLKIAAVEALQLLGAFSDPKMLLDLGDMFRSLLEPHGRFWGAYGDRIGQQLQHCERKLRADPDTRQAVATLWDTRMDNVIGKKDYPCTVSLQFLLRDDVLTMHVNMRSNDVWLGLAYDAFMFTQVQLSLAAVLGVEAGPYHHRVVSLHLYDRDLPAVSRLHLPRVEHSTLPTGIGRSRDSMFDVAERATRIAYREALTNPTASERWYVDQMVAS